MEGLRRVRWTNLARVAGVVGAVVVIVAVGPGLLERPKPPPLAENIGLAGAAKPSNRPRIGAFVSHTETKATTAVDLAKRRRTDARRPRNHLPRRSRQRPRHHRRGERSATPEPAPTQAPTPAP